MNFEQETGGGHVREDQGGEGLRAEQTGGDMPGKYCIFRITFCFPKKVFVIPQSGASNGSSYEDLVGSEVSKKEMARAVK